ncbi:MAG: DUF1501 domain-containing protein [Planctomycetota bacterium]|nr:MAG: DUF1501 domain-containing protein [Planctomycetota bacterium]
MTCRLACRGPSRRDFLAFGMLGAVQAGFPAAGYATFAAGRETIAPRAGILVFLRGGPSHLDTFDPKPDAPAEYRGEFSTIATNVAGLRLCEHLPRLAQCADKFAVLRGVSHTFAAHSLGSEYLYTGSRPLASLKHPTYGAVMARERPPDQPIPAHVALPKAEYGAGFLGSRFGALETGGLPVAGRDMPLRGLALPNAIPLKEFRRRHELLDKLDRRFAAIEQVHPAVAALDQYARQAMEVISAPRTREAFRLSQESPAFARLFGDDAWGAACLLALRLVEAGVRFVTLSLGGWDTHANNFPALKDSLLPRLDQALSGLLTGLSERGLLAATAVLVTGEFGRTPKINGNSRPGRDHYPKCMALLMAGGRVRGGQVVGASDDTGSEPAAVTYSPADVAATFYANMGISPDTVYQTPSGRPITLVRDGSVIRQLFA